MKKILLSLIVVVILLIASFVWLNNYVYNLKQSAIITDYKKAEYIVDGGRVTLGEESKYFGNDLIVDLNSDGREDVVFLMTYERGGSGTFFYVVSAVNTADGYVGSDGYFLGDRIAPQNIAISQNPKHQNVIVVNYADRAPGEPMTASPSVGQSTYLKLDVENMQWGIVEPDFTGEANPNSMSLSMKKWTWQKAVYNDGREIIPSKPGVFAINFAEDNSLSISTDCNNAGGTYVVNGSSIVLKDIFSTLMYCEGSQESEFFQLLQNISDFHFTSDGELILGIKLDSGSVIFK